ncbi:MAG: bifunctional riboflavin kinase/FAD synthetase [Proteobacteria bacterium]|nr:bifunctional riboflavin kinase/FAD synthetase [Pseudomonadota bacterium]
MKLIKDIKKTRFKDTILTLGNFDGLHLGHIKILKLVNKRAKDFKAKSVVYTFDPHPLKVVAPEKSPPLMLTVKDKARLVESFGIDYLVVASFTRKFASKDPREFVKEVLVNGLKVREVIVGHDYAFGKGKRGTISFLRKLGAEFGFKVTVIDAYKLGGKIVSSSRVRAEVKGGRLQSAAKLLGRDFLIRGKVVKGTETGKTIGFPTANLKPETELIPKEGVYAVRAEVDGKSIKGVANIGTAPTFGGKESAIEVHLLNFSGDIYKKTISVAFIRRLRGERSFKSKEALIRQIKRDIERAKALL